jgi:LmbE family N-acetylglucosaminyl deacetylase
MAKFAFFQAHPDDLELNCGYTMHYLSKISKLKHDVKIVSATKGEFGLPGAQYDKFKGSFLAKVRTRELINAQNIHGIPPENIEFLGFLDGFVEFNNDLIKKVRDYLTKEKPDAIFAPEYEFTWYYHKDHVNLGRAVAYVIYKGIENYHPKVFLYTSLAPNFYFPCYEKTFELSNKLIMCHKTQFWLLNRMKLMVKPLAIVYEISCWRICRTISTNIDE